MKDKTFIGLLIVVTLVCAALTVAHFVYAVDAYQHCSIIQFIAGELW